MVKTTLFYQRWRLPNDTITNPFDRDPIILKTLEHLRKNARTGISRGDEEQITQTFDALKNYALLYLIINSSNPLGIEKPDANLAAGYLANSIELVTPHRMTDVIKHGVRQLGTITVHILSNGNPNDISSIIDKITETSYMLIIEEKFRPITLTGIKQLSTISYYAITGKTEQGLSFAFYSLHKNIKFITILLLQIPGSPRENIHRYYLSPYYSLTNDGTFGHQLKDLTNDTLGRNEDDSEAKAVIDKIIAWSGDLYQTAKDVLLCAIEKRSSFTFDIPHWITTYRKYC